jgi:hypothetical protein
MLPAVFGAIKKVAAHARIYWAKVQFIINLDKMML